MTTKKQVIITSNTHVTLKRTKSHLFACHLTQCSSHDVWLHQVFLTQLAHPTIVASELRGDDQPQIALKLMIVFDHKFDTNIIPMFKKNKDLMYVHFPPSKILSLYYNSKQLHELEISVTQNISLHDSLYTIELLEFAVTQRFSFCNTIQRN